MKSEALEFGDIRSVDDVDWDDVFGFEGCPVEEIDHILNRGFYHRRIVGDREEIEIRNDLGESWVIVFPFENEIYFIKP